MTDQPEMHGRSAALHANDSVPAYKNPVLDLDERVADLLGRMSLAEKVGLMFHPALAIGPSGEILEWGAARLDPTKAAATARTLIVEQHIRHFNIREIPDDPRVLAGWYNDLQRVAEGTGHGIPVTIASDPRHAFDTNRATGFVAGPMSQWPEAIGFGAIGDDALVTRFADIARAEYIAVGIRVALSPMADVASEPRWGRTAGTFGADIEKVARLTAAYVRGFQGDELGPESVACMTKHFPGAGPQGNRGDDAHFRYGSDQEYPGSRFEDHLRPFEAAIEAGTAQIMPYYARPVGTELEEVGFAFNQEVITGLLRERYGFDGVVCTDWGLVTDEVLPDGSFFAARAWGVEELDTEARMRRILEAGCDQFGGEALPEVVVALVESGQVPEARIDESARRLLRDKFRLGLFDDPYVDAEAAGRVCGSPEFRQAGFNAQRDAMVVLSNKDVLPIAPEARIYVDGLPLEVAGNYGNVVGQPGDADVAIIYRAAPFEQRDGNFLERRFHAGSLEYSPAERDEILSVASQVPTLLVVHLDRPAILTDFRTRCAGIVAEFGASPEAIFDVLFGKYPPKGRLPFELPSSMEAVEQHFADVPSGTVDPLFPIGHGLDISARTIRALEEFIDC